MATELVPMMLSKDKTMYVEVTVPPDEQDIADSYFSVEDITGTIQEFSRALWSAFIEVKPHKATVEFGLEMSIESGKLTAVLVKGTGKANIKITLEWAEPSRV